MSKRRSLPSPPRPRHCGYVLLLVLGTAGGCGARSALEIAPSPAPAQRDAASDVRAAADAGSPDRECPLQARPSEPCELDVMRVCFYSRGRGLQACRCTGGRWACADTSCEGWGPSCTQSVRSDSCVESSGCGACCTIDNARLVTSCACRAVGLRPICTVEQLCRGP